MSGQSFKVFYLIRYNYGFGAHSVHPSDTRPCVPFFGLQLLVCLCNSGSPVSVCQITAQLALKKSCQAVRVYLYVCVRNPQNVLC